MSAINWRAAGITFGVTLVGTMGIVYSFTLPGRKAWYFTPPTDSPPVEPKPDYNSMFSGTLQNSNERYVAPTSNPFNNQTGSRTGGRTRRKHKGKKRTHKKSRG
jgi:hypothetical protein